MTVNNSSKILAMVKNTVPIFSKYDDGMFANNLYVHVGNLSLYFIDLFQLIKYQKIVHRMYYSDLLIYENFSSKDINDEFYACLRVYNELGDLIEFRNTFSDLLHSVLFEKINEMTYYIPLFDKHILEYFSGQLQAMYNSEYE